MERVAAIKGSVNRCAFSEEGSSFRMGAQVHSQRTGSSGWGQMAAPRSTAPRPSTGAAVGHPPLASGPEMLGCSPAPYPHLLSYSPLESLSWLCGGQPLEWCIATPVSTLPPAVGSHYLANLSCLKTPLPPVALHINATPFS